MQTDNGDVISHVLARLAAEPLSQDPFPHLIVEHALSPEYFRALSMNVPPAALFSQAEYPGTGRFTRRHGGTPTSDQTASHHGLVLKEWSAAPMLQPLSDLFSGDAFARVLLDRFSEPGSREGGGSAIPASKYPAFSNGQRSYSSVFGLYKDLGGYEISPHLDNPMKIVTFLLYLDDDPSCPCPTLLCRPKAGADYANLQAAGYGAAAQEGRAGLWLDWDDFEIVKAVHGPNVLFAFAPNDISFHGVKLPPVPTRGERTVVRGFIARAGYRDTRILASQTSEP
jgi:hypothetical protein